MLSKLLDSGEINISQIDNESFRLCFELGLNKVIKVVLETTQPEGRLKDIMTKCETESMDHGGVSEDYHNEGSVDERDHVPLSRSTQSTKQMAYIERASGKFLLNGKDSKKEPSYNTVEIPHLTQESNVGEEIVIQILE